MTVIFSGKGTLEQRLHTSGKRLLRHDCYDNGNGTLGMVTLPLHDFKSSSVCTSSSCS